MPGKLEACPHVLVVGTGAMASLFGARLERFSGARVTLTGTWTAALEAIAAHGIQVEDSSGAWSARPQVKPLLAPNRPPDLVLVLVKSCQTSAVAPVVARALLPASHVVTLQNGLGNREALEAAAGRGRVSVGVATVGASLLGPGRARATPGSVALGGGDSPPPGLRLCERLLAAAGFETALEPDVDRMLWRKLAVNCAINPLSALLRCRNGDLLREAGPRQALIEAAREAGAVASAKGVDLGGDAAELALAVAERAAANRSSMLQDVERGAQTEIDALSGAVVREARALGMKVPVNESLWRRIVEIEAGAARGATA
jgi:2-dehydropantoate 2-reductase